LSPALESAEAIDGDSATGWIPILEADVPRAKVSLTHAEERLMPG
jgi:hypothetical protein